MFVLFQQANNLKYISSKNFTGKGIFGERTSSYHLSNNNLEIKQNALLVSRQKMSLDLKINELEGIIGLVLK
jgi:hypothetical protein